MVHLRGVIMYNVAAFCAGKCVLDGDALSLSGLTRALSLLDEYTAFTVVTFSIQGIPGKVKNILRYIPFADFKRGAEPIKSALIDLEDEDNTDDADLDSVFAGR